MAETILLVDDEEKGLEFMSSFLKIEGYHIVMARTGTEALAKAEEANPAVVVLDWMMPQMSGLDNCRELRKTPAQCRVWKRGVEVSMTPTEFPGLGLAIRCPEVR